MLKTYELEITAENKWIKYCDFTNLESTKTLVREVKANKQALNCKEYRIVKVITNSSVLIQMEI